MNAFRNIYDIIPIYLFKINQLYSCKQGQIQNQTLNIAEGEKIVSKIDSFI